MPIIEIRNKKFFKNTIGFILYGPPSTTEHPPLPLSAVYIPNEDPVEKTLCSLAINCRLEMAS